MYAISYAVVLGFICVIVGTISFKYLYNVSVFTALYSAISIMTTLGVPKELDAVTPAQQWFIICYILFSAIIFISIISFLIGTYIVSKYSKHLRLE